MTNGFIKQTGINLLVKRYKELFRISENVNYYSEDDFRTAERKFLKFCMTHGHCEIQKQMHFSPGKEGE
jgi:hypothetical protein